MDSSRMRGVQLLFYLDKGAFLHRQPWRVPPAAKAPMTVCVHVSRPRFCPVHAGAALKIVRLKQTLRSRIWKRRSGKAVPTKRKSKTAEADKADFMLFRAHVRAFLLSGWRGIVAARSSIPDESILSTLERLQEIALDTSQSECGAAIGMDSVSFLWSDTVMIPFSSFPATVFA
jgi:hypothetical protein